MSTATDFVKPSDLFKMRRRTSNLVDTPSNSNSGTMSRMSPVKQQRSPVSATKSVATTPIKNRVSQFGPGLHLLINSQSPLKCLDNNASPNKPLPTLLKNPFHQPVKRRLNLCSPRKKHQRISSSPIKKSRRMLELEDEDANLEPSMKLTTTLASACQNDWTLKTKLRINFSQGQCQHFNVSSMNSNSCTMSQTSQTSTELGQKISASLLRKASKVYQHPYLSWLPLYPRNSDNLEVKLPKGVPAPFNKKCEASSLMHKDWCESLEDIFAMLTEGACPYFYLCTPYYDVLFRTEKSVENQLIVLAHISTLGHNLAMRLSKAGIQYGTENFAKQQHEESTPSLENSKPAADPLEDDDSSNFGTADFLNSIDLKPEHLPILRSSSLNSSGTVSKSPTEDSNLGLDEISRQFPSNIKPLATIRGTENARKFIEFLQTNETHTINSSGTHAHIPPTILAPCEFYLSAPRYSTVKSIYRTSFKLANLSPRKQEAPQSLELEGPILPNLYGEIHKLLEKSENNEHTCINTLLQSSKNFQVITFT